MTPAASGKKRPASSDHDDDSDDDSMDNNASFFSRIVSSVTPWKRKNKRARSSLDSMSGSAIKSASRLPTSEDSDRSSHSDGGAGGSGKATLEKLNLEHKFHEAPAVAAAPEAMPVQTLNGQQTANNNYEGNAAKRVRIAESAGTTAPTTTANGTSNGGEGAIKAVRIGGTTFVSSTSKSTNGQSVTFQDATMPRFSIGSSTTKLKDVRGRNATPARGRGDRSKWGTPSAKAARFGSSKNNTLPQDGLMTNGTSGGIAATSNKGGFQRRSIGSLSTTSRGGAYRRRAINARTYKPMGNLLSRIHTDHATGRNGTAAAGQSKQQSLFLSNSIADQILRDTQNKLFQSTASGGGSYQETALFGVAPSDNNNDGARTFQEEEAQYKAVTKKGISVPRVRMNRVFGSGQIGGRAQLESAPSTATASAKSFGTDVVPAASTGAGTTASISLKPSIVDKSIEPVATSFAAPAAPSQIAAAPETKAKAVVAFAPFKSNPIPARDAGKTQFLPCDADENLSQKMGNEISQLASTEAFRRKAAQNNPFGDVSEATKTPKKKKSKGTPHPKKAGGSGMKPVSEAAGGTPFNFMPGGGGASAKVDTPLAFKYGKKTEVPQSSTPAVSKTPAKPVAPVATDTSTSETKTTVSEGWGNIFASHKKQWKCPVCTTQNPLDENVCLSCEAPREGTASKSNATPSGGKNGSDKKATAGTGGFTFGAPSSTTKASAGSIGSGGFSFGSASSSTASTSTPAIKFGATPSKAKEQTEKDDSKTSASSGFTFGTATPAKTKPSSGGFSFGVTPANTSSKADSNAGGSDDKKDDTSKGSVGFSFGASASSSSTTSSKTNATFSFGQNSAPSGADENKGDTANTGAFKFGASSSDPKPKRGRGEDEENGKQGGGKKKTSVGAGFSFGSNATENKSTPTTSFGFGAATKKEDAAPAATFAFGSTPSEEKTDNAASSFAFGSSATDVKEKSNTAPAGASGFSFGQSSADSGATSINAEKKEPSFKFGQAASATEKKDNIVATPAPAFAFGAAAAAKEPAPAAAFQFGSQAPAAAPLVAAAPPPAAASLFGGSGFGMAQSAVPQPAAPVPASAPAFGFGAASQTPAPAPAFGFGGSAQPTAPATNSGFAFGSNPTTVPAPPPAFGMPPAAHPVATPVPAFGLQSAPTPAPTGFAMNSGAASGGFNIGTGGGAKKTPGRRIVKARRPQGSGR